MELLSLVAVTIALVLVFEFVNGFHDSANSIATIVATKVLTPIAAVSLAAVFNFAGIVVGQEVAKTIGKGIIDTNLVWEYGVMLVFCAVVGAIIWDLITWWFGIPTSSSHALVGGLIGAGVAGAGIGAIVWTGTLKTASFIVISPTVGLVTGFALVIVVMWVARKITRTIVNKWFRKLQLASSAFFSFTHGTTMRRRAWVSSLSCSFSMQTRMRRQLSSSCPYGLWLHVTRPYRSAHSSVDGASSRLWRRG